MEKNLEYYENQFNEYSRKLTDLVNKNNKVQGEIDRLQAAYDQLGRIKRSNAVNADEVRNKAKLSKVAGNVQWRGFYKKEFDAVMNERVKNGANEFFTSIDQIHDEIGNALTNKKNDLDSGSSIMNGIRNKLNDLDRTIRNWVN